MNTPLPVLEVHEISLVELIGIFGSKIPQWVIEIINQSAEQINFTA